MLPINDLTTDSIVKKSGMSFLNVLGSQSSFLQQVSRTRPGISVPDTRS